MTHDSQPRRIGPGRLLTKPTFQFRLFAPTVLLNEVGIRSLNQEMFRRAC